MTTLTAVRAYMRARRRASLADIAIGLDTTQDVAHGLLEIWQRKNRARLVSSACGPCGGHGGGCSCASASTMPEVWEWVEEGGGLSSA